MTVALTRLMPAETVGAFFSVTSLFLLLTVLGQLGTGSGIVYFLARQTPERRLATAIVVSAHRGRSSVRGGRGHGRRDDRVRRRHSRGWLGVDSQPGAVRGAVGARCRNAARRRTEPLHLGDAWSRQHASHRRARPDHPSDHAAGPGRRRRPSRTRRCWWCSHGRCPTCRQRSPLIAGGGRDLRQDGKPGQGARAGYETGTSGASPAPEPWPASPNWRCSGSTSCSSGRSPGSRRPPSTPPPPGSWWSASSPARPSRRATQPRLARAIGSATRPSPARSTGRQPRGWCCSPGPSTW